MFITLSSAIVIMGMINIPTNTVFNLVKISIVIIIPRRHLYQMLTTSCGSHPISMLFENCVKHFRAILLPYLTYILLYLVRLINYNFDTWVTVTELDNTIVSINYSLNVTASTLCNDYLNHSVYVSEEI